MQILKSNPFKILATMNVKCQIQRVLPCVQLFEEKNTTRTLNSKVICVVGTEG